MRVASWVLVLCTTLGAVALFLPSLELRLGGSAVSKRTQRSLYQVSSDHALLRRVLAAYHGSSKREAGARLVQTVAPRLTGRPRAALEDVREAMATLDDVTDRDLRTAGTVVRITVFGLLALAALIVLLVFGELMRGAFGRPRLVLALVASGLVTAGAIATHIVCREAVWRVNHELGYPAIAVGPGLYVLPLATIAALVTAVVLVAKRRTPPPPRRPRRSA